MKSEPLALGPAENSAARQNALVAYGAVADTVGMHVIIIGYYEVNAALPLALLEPVEKERKIRAQHIVGVNHLEIFTRRVNDTLIDALSVTAVLLMDNLNDARIFFSIGVSDLARAILRAVVDNYDLDSLTANEQAVYALFHILCRIVTGHGYS